MSTGHCNPQEYISQGSHRLEVAWDQQVDVYLTDTDPPYLKALSAPTSMELLGLVQRISERIGRHLERKGLLVRDDESSHLAFDSGDDSSLAELRGHSIAYRVALGPQRGRKGFMLQSLPPRGEPPGNERVAQAAGFSLHAGVVAAADQRGTLERPCRYVARPAVAIERLSLRAQGHVRYALKTPHRDGTTHVIFEPLDFLARLAALVPSPGGI